ncbi:MAG: radical SAM family heme chaperone HemW [Geoalkalibacter sp.]|uniref:radical SAM family heme chaperone HemW n=1 Tax=Geoalkalibacter sp. TaxID=3041440 RepID=UPI003D0D9453
MSGLYIHIPFCLRKCPYCDFFSAEDAIPADYSRLLCRHLELVASHQPQRNAFQTIFFGGGTPSLMPPARVAEVLDRAADLFGIDAGAEISLEANPGTLTLDDLRGFRAAGINRLSLGVQSLNDASLKCLGRIHDARQARSASTLARRAGFDNLGLDLMFALPGTTLAALEAEITAFVELESDHLSCYGLTVEEGTSFHRKFSRGHLPLPDENDYAAAFELLHARLTARGFSHYEISNYARPGFECRHNLRYWQRRDYLGIGPGAHSFYAVGWGERWSVPGDLERYRSRLQQGADAAERIETFDRRGAMAETLYLGLRTAEGVNARLFQERFGDSIDSLFPEAIQRCGSCLQQDGDRLHFTLQGWLLYDHLISLFL